MLTATTKTNVPKTRATTKTNITNTDDTITDHRPGTIIAKPITSIAVTVKTTDRETVAIARD